MSNGSKAAAALIAGLAVGAALGVLFAPAEGSETRQRISDGAKDLGDKLGSLKNKATGKVNEFLRKNEDTAETSRS